MVLLRSAALPLLASLVVGCVRAHQLRGGPETGRGLDGLNGNIDTDRGAALFDNEYRVGVTYAQQMEMDQTSKLDLGGVEMDQKMHMEMDSEMSVSEVDEPEGGRQIDLTYTRVAVNVGSGAMTMEFDSDSPEAADPAFQPLETLVGHTMEIVLDEDGNVVKASEHEELMKQLGNGGQDAMKDLASPKQFEQMSRMAKALPDEEIKPGDTWDFDDLEMDEMMHYEGTGTLVGYRDFEGRDVAVVALEGEFEFDFEKYQDALGEDVVAAKLAEGVKITEGRMTCTMFWDNQDKFVRFTELTQTMTVEMNNPIDGSVMQIPTDQVIKVKVEIKE